jgi:hypothetical protein
LFQKYQKIHLILNYQKTQSVQKYLMTPLYLTYLNYQKILMSH